MAAIVHEIAPESKIIPIQARGLKDKNYQEYLIKGIYYAADHGAVAVSSSMGPTKQSDELRKAIDYAEEKGMVFIDVHPERVIGADGKLRLCETGECDPRIIHPGVVSVPDYPVDPEPNRDIYTWPYDLDASYEDGWGYSNAPPTVMGVIALMKGVSPKLTPAQVRDIIKTTASEKNGFRVLDAQAAVSAARDAVSR
jgi:subtilisin family serine protease